ncbi:hypothetical protein HNY73_013950 [Argiope bruennichi]|uniref:Uncharacterized protein n=1 Tax=Argiope bruennichi TaxID=94029 RepID=A0A8T0EMJ7_ARGBR|nr:hypothetical protein HNY73_013950 [Argiope bruennichi]
MFFAFILSNPPKGYATAIKASLETSSGVITNYITTTHFNWSGGGSEPTPINSNNDTISVSDSARNDGASFVSNPAKGIGVSSLSAPEESIVERQYNNRDEAEFAIEGEPSIKRIGDAILSGASIGKNLYDSINLGIGGTLGSLFGSTGKAAPSGEKIVENKNANTCKPGFPFADVNCFKGIDDKITSVGHAVATKYGNTDKPIAPGGVSSNGVINGAVTPGKRVVVTHDNSGKPVFTVGGVSSFPGMSSAAAPERSISAINYGNSGEAGAAIGGIPSLEGIGDIAAPRGNVVNTQYGNTGSALSGLLSLLGATGDSPVLGAKDVGTQNNNSGKPGFTVGGVSSFPEMSGAAAPERSVSAINYGNSGEAGAAIGGIPSPKGIGDIAAPRGNVVNTQFGNTGSALSGLLSLLGPFGDSAVLRTKDVGTQNDNSGKPGLPLGGVSSFPDINGAIAPERSVSAINYGISGEAGAAIGGIPSLGGIGDIAAPRGNVVNTQYGNTGSDLGGLLSLVGGTGDSATLGAKGVETQNDNSGKAGLSLGGLSSFPGAVPPERSVSAINYGNSGETGAAIGSIPSFESVGDIAASRGNVVKTQCDNVGSALGGVPLVAGIGGGAAAPSMHGSTIKTGHEGLSSFGGNGAVVSGGNIVGTQYANSVKPGIALAKASSFGGVSGAVAPERNAAVTLYGNTGPAATSEGDAVGIWHDKIGGAGFSQERIPSIGAAASAGNVGESQYNSAGSAFGEPLLAGGINLPVLNHRLMPYSNIKASDAPGANHPVVSNSPGSSASFSIHG